MASKQLLLFRHGKSDWDADFSTDHERPVSKRGRQAAQLMGRVLARSQYSPDAVITSSAVRARTTVELAAEAGQWSCPIRVSAALYEATPDQVLAEIRQAPQTSQTLLLAGHEPTWSALAAALIGGGQLRVPTAALLCIDCQVADWQTVDRGVGQLLWLLPPKFFSKGDFKDLHPPGH
ncbi:Phosphohistidine phosphatase SixA [Halomicronema hongdechloris C2206]|uniref:Phosphohistidine phosphatase SixA n=1 Tax=Halomicronema hongdechloris C2206 TaxID=1641165 RepID=A0A1Z3HUQ1_9CYAN|nr:histidine phosphatase family protein [Halomicronema hongdechloris]ASC74013.1 Phosphohistidine phosphatase SixA [Halomicronema hongdechloris C2206]